MWNNISNIASIIKERMVRKTIEAQDVVPFAAKDDNYDGGYRPALIQGADLITQVKEAACESNKYYAGIYDLYPYIITPSMTKSCLAIIDTPAFPTFLAANLEAYKIFGSVDVSNQSDMVYLGTVQASNPTVGFALFGSAKITGSVDAYDALNYISVSSAFSPGALIQDADTGGLVPMTTLNISTDNYAPDAFDLYLVWTADTTYPNIQGAITFEYEFFVTEGSQVTFIID